MDTIDLSEAPFKVVACYGLYATRTKGLTRKETLALAFATWPFKWVAGEPFLSVSFPCGEEMECGTLDDVPLVDVPCPCGHGRWRRYDSSRRELMRAELERIADAPGLSKDVFEIDRSRRLATLPRAEECVQCGACLVPLF